MTTRLIRYVAGRAGVAIEQIRLSVGVSLQSIDQCLSLQWGIWASFLQPTAVGHRGGFIEFGMR